MAEKRYYWLKLYDDFFDDKRIKKLRSIAGGDTYTIIYLKMKLKALNTNGFLYYDGVMDTFAEELALDINEDPDNVKLTIQYLISKDLMVETDEVTFQLTCMDNEIGSETASTQRVRDFRSRQKALHCNADETETKRVGNVDIDIEKDKEIDKENNKKKFVPPTLEEVQAYCLERNSNVDPQTFYEYFTAGNWKDSKGQPVKNWKQKIITWENHNNGNNAGRNSTTNQTRPLIEYRLSDV